MIAKVAQDTTKVVSDTLSAIGPSLPQRNSRSAV